jgi:hypothetical protein
MRKGWAAVAFLILSLTVAVAHAEDSAADSVRLTPDTTKIIRLEQDATSVIVANPNHASVVLDSPRLLVVMPHQPGTTLFTVLNAKGETILEKNIIVSGMAKPQYVRIRRACSAGDANCNASSYYYCPDGCYEVTPVRAQGDGIQAPPIASSGGGGNSIADNNDVNAPSLPEQENTAPAQQVAPPSEAGGGPQVITPPSMPEPDAGTQR